MSTFPAPIAPRIETRFQRRSRMLREAASVQTANRSAGGPMAVRARVVVSWRVLAMAVVLSLVLAAALYESLAGGRSSVPAAVRAHAFSQEGLLSLPLTAQGPASASPDGDGAAYWVSASKDGFAATSPAQHLSSRFARSGASLSSGGVRVGFRLQAVGYGSSLTALGGVAPRAHGSRVVYARPGLSEWYVNRPQGLEQGFTLARAPARHMPGPLTLSIALSGNAHAALERGGQGITLARAGETVLRYTGLSATDARGHVLPSSLALEGGRLLLRVNAAGARYPLRIDPLIQRIDPAISHLPIAETEPAESVTATSAILTGRVNREGGGALTECEFEYEAPELDRRYKDSCEYIGAEEGEDYFVWIVAAEVVDLEPHTTYVFWLDAANRNGSSYGGTEGFRTLSEGPAVETGEASSITRASATLNATVNPWGEEVKACYFEWGTTTSYGKVAPCSSLPEPEEEPVAVSAKLEGLSERTTYHFRVVATNPGGTNYGEDETFETRPYAPAAVTDAASAIARNAATLNATVNPNGEEVKECFFEWGTTTGYGDVVQCSSLPGAGESPVAVSAPLKGLRKSTTYHFRVVATNALGTSYGEDETFGTPPYPPTVVTEAASSIAQTSATLNATVNPNGTAVSNCEFDVGTTTSYGSIVPCSSLPESGESPVAVSASVTGLAADTTYHFRIVATNPNGTSDGADQTFTTLPDPPTVVTASASSIMQTLATLNGTVNPNGGRVSDCHFDYGTTSEYGSIMRCSSLPESGESPVAVSASVTGLAADTTYHFRIVATNPSGTSEGGDQTFTTPEYVPPTVVTGAASSITQTSATLEATVNPNGGTVGVCMLEYGTTLSYGSSAGCGPSPGSGSSPVAVSASLTGLTEGTTYHYRVAATNPGGTSEGDDQTFTTHSAPEFGRCAKVVTGTGKYGNSGCKSLGGKHNYEWTPGVVATRFTTKIKSGEATLETAKGWKMTCTGETSTGGYTGLKTVGDVVLTLTGCERSGEKCSSGLTAGEIDSNPLEGALGVDRGGGSSPTNKIGLDLFPNKGPAMEFNCGTTAVSIQGSVIVPVTPNRTSLTPVLKFAASKGKQKPESFVGKSSDVLEASFNGGSSEQAGLALVTTQTNEEPVEVNSVY